MAETTRGNDLSTWPRIALAATGVVGTGVFFFAAFSPNLPMYGDSLNEWSGWAPTHQADARSLVATLLLAYLLYMIFAVYVTTVVRTNDPLTRVLSRLAAISVGVKFAIELMQIAILNVATQVSSQNFDRSIQQLGQNLSIFTLVPFAIFLLGVGAAALISPALPTWLAWFTLTVGAIHAFAMVLGVTGAHSLGPILYAFGFVWFTSIFLWPLVTSASLLVISIRGSRAADRMDPMPDAGGAVTQAGA